jgi:hypothetical protein
LEKFEEKHDFETAWSVWVNGVEMPFIFTILEAGEYAEGVFDCGYGDEVVEIKPFESGYISSSTWVREI